MNQPKKTLLLRRKLVPAPTPAPTPAPKVGIDIAIEAFAGYTSLNRTAPFPERIDLSNTVSYEEDARTHNLFRGAWDSFHYAGASRLVRICWRRGLNNAFSPMDDYTRNQWLGHRPEHTEFIFAEGAYVFAFLIQRLGAIVSGGRSTVLYTRSFEDLSTSEAAKVALGYYFDSIGRSG